MTAIFWTMYVMKSGRWTGAIYLRIPAITKITSRKNLLRIESDLASIDKAKNLFRKELEWMRKQPKARTTKSKSRQDAFYVVESKAKQNLDEQNLTLQMKMSRLGGKIAELKKVNKSFGEKIILKGFDYTFKQGDRIGVVGKNGAGKTTFLNMLQGLEPPDSGKDEYRRDDGVRKLFTDGSGNKRRYAGDRVCKKYCRKFPTGRRQFAECRRISQTLFISAG